MNQDLKIIKKKFGEAMMHLCRDLFPTILEEEGKLSQLLLDHFEPTHELYYDIIKNDLTNNFKKYIYCLLEEKENNIYDVSKTPEELLNEVGYTLFECKTEKDIQKFKKYYAKGEELCTFNGERLNRCHVFFAVKKDVDKIKREDYQNPERQDEYGTSVISIQFTKDPSHTLSIKNRYNHKVENPDATFSNNLDNIIPGLTNSFAKYYDLKQKYKSNNFEIPDYVFASDGKYYKYNHEIYNIYYCPNNIIIDHFQVRKLPKEKYIVLDYFLLDLQNKKIEAYDKRLTKRLFDSFIDNLKDIKDIRVEKNEKGRIVYIIPNSGEVIEIELDKENNIIGYKNNNLDYIGDNFLQYNEKLEHIECNYVKEIGSNFLRNNMEMEKIYLPNVIKIGCSFLSSNEKINKVDLPLVETISYSFLCSNESLLEISLPNVLDIKINFISRNCIITKADLPKVKSIGGDFLQNNLSLKELNLPSVEFISDTFLYENINLVYLELPNVRKIGSYFLNKNNSLKVLNLPNVKFIGGQFMRYNNSLEELNLPNVITIGEGFLNINNSLESSYTPNLVELGEKSLIKNTTLKSYDFSSLKKASKCLTSHPTLKFKLNTLILKNHVNYIRSKFKGNNRH